MVVKVNHLQGKSLTYLLLFQCNFIKFSLIFKTKELCEHVRKTHFNIKLLALFYTQCHKKELNH